MELIVNGRDNEDVEPPQAGQTLEDYISDLNDQFGKINRVAQIETVNGEEFQPQFYSWASERVEQMEISIKPIEEVVVNTLMSLARYLDQALGNLPSIIENWEKQGQDDIQTYVDQLDEAFTTIDQILTSIVATTDVEDRLESLNDIQSRTRELDRKLQERTPDNLRDVFENTHDLFSELRTEIENVVQLMTQKEEFLWRNLSEISNSIRTWIEDIPDLVENLQTGDDSKAYDRIENAAEDLDRIIIFMNQLDEAGKLKMVLSPEQQEELRTAHSELETGIDELQDAFENNDVIMICDILEYEILPYLKDVDRFLDDLEMEMQAS